MTISAEGEAGIPGVVATSNVGKETLSAAALGIEEPKDKKQRTKPKLPLPTSIVEENKQKKQQLIKQRPSNINIPSEENNSKEGNKMKQPSIKEFVQFAKKKSRKRKLQKWRKNSSSIRKILKISPGRHP